MTDSVVRTKRDIIAQLTREYHLDTSQARKVIDHCAIQTPQVREKPEFAFAAQERQKPEFLHT